MKLNYKITTYFLIAVVAALVVTVGVLASSESGTDSVADLNTGNDQMYTLADIYERLDNGTAGTKQAFQEPGAGPSTGTMYTLNDIMGKAPAVDDTDGAGVADVASGKTFWGLTSGEWGLQTGTSTGTPPCNCDSGTLNGTRWCDNGDGTVTDLLGNGGVGQCLVWAQDASWGGGKPWRSSSNYDDAHTRASAYGAETENWRLPTRAELDALTHGTESVRLGTPRAFTNIQSTAYWSSTSDASNNTYARTVSGTGAHSSLNKTNGWYVWPVRGGQ